MEYLLLESRGFFIFGFEIKLYGFIMAVAMLVGILVAVGLCKMKKYDTDIPINLALFALPFAIIGARLYFCIFYGVDSFLSIFKIWQGGLAIYGGVIGGFLGILLCCKIKKIPLLTACDIAAPCLILGQAIGRIGCYFGGCCYGVETVDPNLQFFPMSVLIHGEWHLATFFYESFWNFICFWVLFFVFKNVNIVGVSTSCYFILYGIGRAVIETFRGDSLYIWNTTIKVSQLLSVILVFVGAFMLTILLMKNKKSTISIEGRNNG